MTALIYAEPKDETVYPPEDLVSVGFTGTRRGLTKAQRLALEKLIFEEFLTADEFHHGGARGADAEFHHIVISCTNTGVIHLHPGAAKSSEQRAIARGHITYDIKPPLERNQDIVNASTVLIVCPMGLEEELRSGTWATMRYARKVGKPIIFVWPDGTVTHEE